MKRAGETKRGRRQRTSSGQTVGTTVARIQTGVRMEKRILLVLKALAGSLDVSLGDLLEGIALHAFEGKAPFGPETLAKIKTLKDVYALELTAADSHHLIEAGRRTRAKPS